MKNCLHRIFALLIVLIAATLFSRNVTARPDTLSFLHLTDTHLIFDLDYYKPEIAKARGHYAQGIVPLQKFLQDVPSKTRHGFAVISGDLIDFYQAERPDGSMYGFQAEQFAKLISEFRFPVFLTLGNHDITSYKWTDNSRVSSQSIAGKARASWMKNVPCFNEGTYYSRLFNVGNTLYRLIFLDNSFYIFGNVANESIPYADKAQLAWLENQLQESDEDVEIVLMHLPLAYGQGDSDPENDIYTVLSRSSSVKLILAGHRHQNTIQKFGAAGNSIITQIQTGAFALDNNNWRLIHLTERDITITLPGNEERELTIPVK